MTDDRILSVLRSQAWQRAKGEIASILITYYNDKRFERMELLAKQFVIAVEDEGLTE